MKENKVFLQKITFSDYFQELPEEERIKLRDKITPIYMSYPSFYGKLRGRTSWKPHEQDAIEKLTKKSFLW